MVIVGQLLNDLLDFSERAAEIARCLRKQNDLFESIIEEKDDQSGKNQRFQHDFKTIADVLIQQSLKWFISRKHPNIDDIKGEENNKFTNSKGVTVEIEVKDSSTVLERLLTDLIGNADLVRQLIDIIYKDENGSAIKRLDDVLLEEEIDDQDIGIYIDPIDCTNEYVKGDWSSGNENRSFAVGGLSCVTCLIGCFSKKNGKAFMGVINLPFYSYESNSQSFTGKCIWGLSLRDINLNNLNNLDNIGTPVQSNQSNESKRLRIVLSSAENKEIIDKLFGHYDLVYASGLGYKLFLVLTNQVDLFLITRASSYKWDCCAASAIFKSFFTSKGANLVELMKMVGRSPISRHQSVEYEIKYNTDVYCNKDGLIGYLDHNLLNEVLSKLES